MPKTRVIAAAVAAAFVLCWIQPAGAQQPNFPPKDTKQTQTVGMAVFWVHPQYRTLVENLPGWDPATKHWTIPYMEDLASKIANSDQHLDGDATDHNGTPVGDANTQVADGDFRALPVSGFEPGPANTKEVHTEIWSLRMKDRSGKFTLRAGPGADVTDQKRRSIGEVEAKQAAAVFPAESFFDVFVEVDTPFFGGSVLYNKAPLVVLADDVRSFPPRGVYTHSGTSEAVPIFFRDRKGPPFGHLILAGHGVNVEAEKMNERMKKAKHLPCPGCKEPPGQARRTGTGD